MAEPLSFVASVVAVSTLAGSVVSKGYRYIKAVKECPEDVRRLIAEVNAFYGILERLVVLLTGSKRSPILCDHAVANSDKILQYDSGEHGESDASSSSDDEDDPSNNNLHVPDYIYECQKTLQEIDSSLSNFVNTKPQSSQSANEGFRLPKRRHLGLKDLRWPLSRSQAMQLLETLERHKSTCTIALASDGLVGIHSVLEQTKISNRYLAELRATQEKFWDLHITEKEGEWSFTGFPSQTSGTYVTIVIDTAGSACFMSQCLRIIAEKSTASKANRNFREGFGVAIARESSPKATGFQTRTTSWYWYLAVRSP